MICAKTNTQGRLNKNKIQTETLPTASPNARSGARLTPESATLAMVALRVYADLLEQVTPDQ
jgi:hypothetical protein